MKATLCYFTLGLLAVLVGILGGGVALGFRPGEVPFLVAFLQFLLSVGISVGGVNLAFWAVLTHGQRARNQEGRRHE